MLWLPVRGKDEAAGLRGLSRQVALGVHARTQTPLLPSSPGPPAP